MRKLWLVPMAAAAAIASGCGSRPQQERGWQTCVDRTTNRVAEERECQSQARSGGGSAFMWYYYPYGGAHYPVGYGVPSGGHYAAQPFQNVPTRSIGIPRGGTAVPRPAVRSGFGSTATGAAAS